MSNATLWQGLVHPAKETSPHWGPVSRVNLQEPCAELEDQHAAPLESFDPANPLHVGVATCHTVLRLDTGELLGNMVECQSSSAPWRFFYFSKVKKWHFFRSRVEKTSMKSVSQGSSESDHFGVPKTVKIGNALTELKCTISEVPN